MEENRVLGGINQPNAAVCTLFEGNYHYGVGALVNSLYQNGFRGVIWAGYRGDLPPWARSAKSCDDFYEMAVAADCVIRFVKINVSIHMTHFKPVFMKTIMEKMGSEEYLCYFDPDIVIKCRWSFFMEWISNGVAVCGDYFSMMPSDHPFRYRWKKYAEKRGYQVQRQLNQYFNAGFVGLPIRYKSMLSVWEDLIQNLPEEGISLDNLMLNDRTNPFNVPDQDLLNVTFMVGSFPLSSMGPEAMDIVGGGFVMSHAIGSPKPWQKRFVSQALTKGRRPSAADRLYFKYTSSPIELYSEDERRAKYLKMTIGSWLGKVIPSRG